VIGRRVETNRRFGHPLKNGLAKEDFHVLVHDLDPTTIDPEITTVLDALLTAIQHARPAA